MKLHFDHYFQPPISSFGFSEQQLLRYLCFMISMHFFLPALGRNSRPFSIGKITIKAIREWAWYEVDLFEPHGIALNNSKRSPCASLKDDLGTNLGKEH